MLDLFKRLAAQAKPDTTGLGTHLLAQRMPAGSTIGAPCIGIVFDQGGQMRRVGAGARLALNPHETALCFHPGPYQVDLLPFAGAPELAVRVSFAIDCPDPRVTQQRFDLYLVSEADQELHLDAFAATIESAMQRELAQGNLALPPCTTLAEWNAFRAGLNQLLYIRFGITVDDCIPVDLGATVDYAQLLMARAEAEATPALPELAAAPALTFNAQADDARALRRLFLELPCVMCALRLSVLPGGQAQFRQHQELLQRLDRVSLMVNTMPALELSAPGQPRQPLAQAERAHSSLRALSALDEAWALLARLKFSPAEQLVSMLDDADRIVANLELAIDARRTGCHESEPA